MGELCLAVLQRYLMLSARTEQGTMKADEACNHAARSVSTHASHESVTVQSQGGLAAVVLQADSC